MPLALDSPKDLWGQALILKARFSEREAMLQACEEALSIQKTRWDRERRQVIYEGEKAQLLAQQQAATVRVAVPFKVRLPNYPDHSARDQERLENTELALESCWRMAEAEAARQQLRSPQYDMGASAVELGAICAMPYFYQHPRYGWRAKIEVYNPRYVYYQADDEGLTWCVISYNMREARLAGLVHDQKWYAAYDVSGQTIRTVFHIWTRQEGVVYDTVVGQPLAGEIPENLLPIRERPEHKDIPVLYLPAGGPFTRRSLPGGQRDDRFDQTYGQPFIAPMLAAMDAKNLLTRISIRTGLEAASPPRAFTPRDPDASPKRAPEFELGESTVVDGTIQVVPTVNPGVIPALQAEAGNLQQLIQQVGLPQVTLAGYPFPRSELLRQGLDEAGQMALAPYNQCYAKAIEGLSEGFRSQLLWLFESGQARTISLEITPRGQVTVNPQREMREYEQEDFWPDGLPEVILRPKQPQEEVVRNAQVYLLLRQAMGDSFDEAYWQELLLAQDQPEKALDRARRDAIYRLLEPETRIMALRRHERILAGIERKVLAAGSVAKANLDAQESDLLKSLAVWAGLSGDIEEMQSADIRDLVEFLRVSIKGLRDRILPNMPPNGKGQAPPPGAEVAPAAAPSQGSPAGNGRTGGGGPNDIMANYIRGINLGNDLAAGGGTREGA